jgi:predicted naringenin-chalcone synthase
MAYLYTIATAVPENELHQTQAVAFMHKHIALTDREKEKLSHLFQATGIEKRYTVLSDYIKNSIDDYTFFPKNETLTPFPSTQKRMREFQKYALPLSVQATKPVFKGSISPKDVTHVITVSCTGLYAPGLDIELIQELGIYSHVQRTAVQYMGCYAAFNALKLAYHICNSDVNAVVLIVATELCSLHFQNYNEADSILANALFGDGSAAAVITGKKITEKPTLKIKEFYADIYSEGKSDMAWYIGDTGFEMLLSQYIPKLVEKGVPILIEKLLSRFENIQIQHYATHPGGKKILQAVEKALKINSEKHKNSYSVLSEYGNMSSATVLFVLASLLNDIKKGEHVLSIAFGPGLTLESMLFEVV